MNDITSFKGAWNPLSNFWRAEIRPYWWPESLPAFPGNEWLFQAWKVSDTLPPHSWLAQVEAIRTMDTPQSAKYAGKSVHIRPNWNNIRIDVMRYCVQLKFRNHADLRELLLSTEDATLIEGNHWGDRFWGAEWDRDFGWVGENWLGKLLMEEREALRGI